MRKSKIINIEGLGEVTIKEVSPLAVLNAMTSESKAAELLSLASDCLSLSKEQLQKLYPSEIEMIVDAFKEVNSSFFEVVGKLGLRQTLDSIVEEALKTLPPLFANSYKMITAKRLGTTDGTSSS